MAMEETESDATPVLESDGSTKYTDEDGELRRSIQITKHTNRSTRMWLLHTLIRPFSSLIVKQPKPTPAGSIQLQSHPKARLRCNISERRVDDIYMYDLTPRDLIHSSDGERRRKRIYYFSGGGWQAPASSEHWKLVAELACKLPDTMVSLVSYPLAPNSAAPVAFPMLVKLYHTLLKQAQADDQRIALVGDSAGGNIILSLVAYVLNQDRDAPVPAAIMALSPSTDLRRQNPDIECIARNDPILRLSFIKQTASAWRGEWDAFDPRVSPLAADFRPLAQRNIRVHGVTGGYDMLAPDAVMLREKLEDAGVQGQWLDWEKQMHVWPLAWSYGLPESVQAKDWIIEVLKEV